MEVSVCVTVTVRADGHAVTSTAIVSLVRRRSDATIIEVGLRPIFELSLSGVVFVASRELRGESSSVVVGASGAN